MSDLFQAMEEFSVGVNMFKKAEKSQAAIKLAITGPSGSGKTYSALRIANGMGKRIAVVDTEDASASLYSDRFQFDLLELKPPYTIDKYLKGIDAAIAAKYDVLIVDSLTHAWAAEGGLLDKKNALDSRGGNSYTNWATITKEHETLISKIQHADITMICTMRSKQEYVLEQNEKGKSIPKKVGMAPVQREGLEYNFTIVFDLGMDHQAMVSKDRTSLFDNKIFTPTEETGKTILQWKGGVVDLKSSVDIKAPQAEVPAQITQTLEELKKNTEIAKQSIESLFNPRRGGSNDYVPLGGEYAKIRLGDVPFVPLMEYGTKLKSKFKPGETMPNAVAELLKHIDIIALTHLNKPEGENK